MTDLRTNYFSVNLDIGLFKAAENTADTTTLAEAAKSALMLSMDGRLSLSQRAILNALGGRLRKQLRKLIGEIFDAGTPLLTAANSDIRAVNKQLDEAKQDLDKIADTVEGLGKLVASLDKLISIVGKAV